jgi:hypothetical protein
MLNWLDKLLPWLFIASLGFIMASFGVVSAHLGWWPASVIKKVEDTDRKQKRNEESVRPSKSVVTHYQPEKVYRGYTLFTTRDSSASLVDMNGAILHSWRLPYKKVFTGHTVGAGDKAPYIAFATAYSNGDLLAIYHSSNPQKEPVFGMGLVKMNRASDVIWEYSGNVHDALYLSQEGDMYTLTHETNSENKRPEWLKYDQPPRILDNVLVLSAEGKVKKQLPVLEAFNDTPYEQYLYSANADFLYTHVNSVMLLEKDIADKFPLFQAGDLLISIRNLDLIAVLRPKLGKIVWAASGIWQRPADARFTDRGTITLFDSRGAIRPSGMLQTRVLEFNPSTRGIPYKYTHAEVLKGKNLMLDGTAGSLPGGNLLTMQGMSGKVREVAVDGEVVWEFTYVKGLTSVTRMPENFFDKFFWLGEQKVQE